MCADFATEMITQGKSDKGSLAQWGSMLEENEITGREWTKMVNTALRAGSDYAVALLISCLGRFAVKFDEDTLIALMSSGEFAEREIMGFATEIMKHGAKLVLSKEYRKEFVSGEYMRRKYPDTKVWVDPKIKELLGLEE
jgi:hypothetical protein